MGIQKIYYALTVLIISFFGFAPLASGQEIGDKQNGLASWYGVQYHGRPTSSGEIYNRHKLTAAHNELPLGTRVKVTNKATGKSVVVKINDRGPFRGARIIDLSEAAAKKLSYRKEGLADVTVEVLDLPEAFLAKQAKSKELEPKQIILAADIAPAPTPATLPTAVPASSVSPSKASATASVSIPASPTPTLRLPEEFVIQAGAYSNLVNAQAQLEKLRRIYQKMPMMLVEEKVNGQKVHRILAGRFVSKATAEQARQDLVKKGFQGLVKKAPEPVTLATAASL
ncbi:septal ring lytic transglycosylase RlpA family protein [Rufibacter tibetensis]|uniref:septal ring lytic transglycosylase RlpA family protein n=1 Tax=Rufibacter tibetensis TaxID=512763 RepID=UPI00078157DF|nr:septal ring lytic transglycosylase RlpA family protein [Rufibacter tibetensis]